MCNTCDKLLLALKNANRFMKDAPELDYNEDTTLSWIQYTTYTNDHLIAAIETKLLPDD